MCEIQNTSISALNRQSCAAMSKLRHFLRQTHRQRSWAAKVVPMRLVRLETRASVKTARSTALGRSYTDKQFAGALEHRNMLKCKLMEKRRVVFAYRVPVFEIRCLHFQHVPVLFYLHISSLHAWDRAFVNWSLYCVAAFEISRHFAAVQVNANILRDSYLLNGKSFSWNMVVRCNSFTR